MYPEKYEIYSMFLDKVLKGELFIETYNGQGDWNYTITPVRGLPGKNGFERGASVDCDTIEGGLKQLGLL